MDASKYLTGMELQPVSIETEGAGIPGYELRLRWIDILNPDTAQLGEPLVIDEESLVALIENLREQVRQVQLDEQRPSGPPH